jgi:hypothetical protein
VRHYAKNAAYRLVFSVLLILFPASQGWPENTETARIFLDQIYAHYVGPGNGLQSLGKDAPKLFAPELLALIREDQRNSQGEVGLLDHDPICSCQDFENLKVTKIKVTQLGPSRAKAKVDFVNGGRKVEVGFLLIRKSCQWRILDVQESNVPSLKSYLKNGLKEANQK